MRRSQVAAPLIGAVVGALIAYMAQTVTEVQMGDCPHANCPPPAAGHATALGVVLGIAIGAFVVAAAVVAVNRFIDRSLTGG